MNSWAKLACLGSTNAVSGLSQMINKKIRVTALSLQEVSEQNAVGLIGKADDPVVGIYLVFSGNATGQIVLAFEPKTALALVDMAMGLTEGSTQTLGDMEVSVLGEMGNIAGSFFLTGVADNTGTCLLPSPPGVVMDMAGSIIGSVMAEAWQVSETAFAIKLAFSADDRHIDGLLLALPNPDMISAGLSPAGGGEGQVP